MILVLGLSFAVLSGCGKDNSSGGSSKSTQNANPYNSSNPYYQAPSNSAKVAMDNALAWYRTRAETPTQIGPRTEQRDQITLNDPKCSERNFLGIFDVELCKQGGFTRSALPARTINVVLSNDKSLNSKLARAFNPGGGATILNAVETSSPMMNGGKLYRLTYVKTNGHTLYFVIDTGLNSAFNPVEIYESEIKSGEVVTNPFQLK